MSVRLPRVQLFEFNDFASMPAAVRDTVVESLSRALDWGCMLEGLVAPLQSFLQESAATELLDLGAGGGGPARILAKATADGEGTKPTFILTDFHPRPSAWAAAAAEQPGRIAFESASVDATNIPEALGKGRARTIINVLHHFPPELATLVLKDAVKGSRGVFVSEAFSRNPLQYANFALAGLPALLANPILSPNDRLAKALLTWFTPAALAIALWDGLVSTLRVYTEEELRTMVAPFGADWKWEYGTYAYFPFGTGYYFYGVPHASS